MERGWDTLQVKALYEGEEIEPWEPVMHITGDYSLFAHLETVYLGCMARRTLVMRNVRAVVDAARGKQILFFPARHDHWLVQTGDGWAAHVAGAIGVSTDAQASWWGGRGMGTVPHALIAVYGGDTVAAAEAFASRFADEMSVVVLVDFENHSVRTAVEVADALGDRLWGVRLDTSETLVDESIADLGDACPRCRARARRARADVTRPSWAQSRPDRRIGRLRRRADRGVRGGGGAGRRLRRGVVALARPERLHGGRRAGRGEAVRQGRARIPPESPPRTGALNPLHLEMHG